MSTLIQIKRSSSNASPNTLANGELFYSFVSNTLFIGNSTNAVFNIGGFSYTSVIDARTSQNVGNTLVLRTSNGISQFNQLEILSLPTLSNHVATKEYTDLTANSLQSYTSNSYAQANAAYNQANLAYASSNAAANTVLVSADYSSTQNDVSLNFNTTGTVNVAVSSGIAGNANVEFTVNTAGAGILTAQATAQNAYSQANAAYNEANLKLNIIGGTITGNLTIAGNLEVLGNSTTLNVETLVVEDNEIILNGNVAATPTLNAFITINRGTSPNVNLKWNEDSNKWEWTDNGTDYYTFDTSLNAYAQANAARDQANNAYNQSNNAYGQANSAYSSANNAANTVLVSLNSTTTFNAVSLNYNHTPTINVSLESGVAGNSNLSFSVNVSGSGITTAQLTAENAYAQANAARDQANSAYSQANIAYTQANNAYSTANTSGNTTSVSANTDSTQRNVGLNFSNTATINVSVGAGTSGNANIEFNVNITGSGIIAAYNQANAAYGQANLAYAQANAARDQSNSAYSQANNAYGRANDAYSLANSAYDQANTATSIAQNSYTQANAAYNQANIAYGQANSAYAQANAAYEQANLAYFAANTSGNTTSVSANTGSTQRNVGLNFSNTSTINVAVGVGTTGNANVDFVVNRTGSGIVAAHDQANAAYSQANAAYSQANSAYSQANNAYSQANAAYTAANNSNLLSGGAITGTLNVSNDLIVGGNIYLQGNTTYINVATYTVNDPLIYLAANNNLTDSVDIGFIGAKNTSGVYSHTGLARDATDTKWKLFDNLPDDAHVNNVINFANSTVATLVANIEANSILLLGNAVATNVMVNAAYFQANSAYNQANAAYEQANLAYSAANTSGNTTSVSSNTGSTQRNVGLNFSNTSTVNVSVAAGTTGNANIEFVVNRTGSGIVAAHDQANAAYNQANAAYDAANSAVANSSGPAYATANAAANTVAVFANGTLVLTRSNLNFNNSATVNVNAVANGATQSNIEFTVNTTSTGVVAAYTQANNAYTQANLAYTAANNAAVKVAANDGPTISSNTIVFNNTSTVSVIVEQNGANANISFTSGGGLSNIRVSQNSSGTINANGFNFVNTSTVFISVTSGANGNANISFSTPISSIFSDTFTANGAQSNFNLSGTSYSTNTLFVFVDGVSQVPGTDYTVSGNVVTFTSPPEANGIIEARSFQGVQIYQPANNIIFDPTELYAAASSLNFTTGGFSNKQDSISRTYLLRGTTTDGAETELFLLSSARIPVAANTTVFYTADIVARRTDVTGESAGYYIKGVVDNFSGTVADVGDLYEVVVAEDDLDYAVDARADDTNNTINFYVTGETGKTIRWTALVRTIEVAQ